MSSFSKSCSRGYLSIYNWFNAIKAYLQAQSLSV